MPFTPVNELEQLLVKAATDPRARPAFYRALLEQDLFIPTDGKLAGDGVFNATKDTPIQIHLIQYEAAPHALVFTAVERISAAVPEKTQFVSMNGRAILTMLRGQQILLNLGSAYGKTLNREEVESILDGSIFGGELRVPAGTKLQLGQPANYPHHLTEALSRQFEKTRDVVAAYLALITVAGDEPHVLIGLEVNGDFHKVAEGAGAVVTQLAKKGEVVDFVPVKPTDASSVSVYLQRRTTPFYKRKKRFGLF